jgi:hypothetical protein
MSADSDFVKLPFFSRIVISGISENQWYVRLISVYPRQSAAKMGFVFGSVMYYRV